MKTSSSCIRAAIAFASMSVLYGCAQESPSFSEDRRTTRVNVSVDDSDATGEKSDTSSEQSSEHLNGMEDEEVSSIFGSLGNSEENGSETIESSSTNSESTGDSSSETIQDAGNSEASLSEETKNTDKEANSGSSGKSTDGSVGSSDDGTSGSEEIVEDTEPLPTPNTGSDDEDQQTPSPAEMTACAQLNGVSASSLKIVGNKSSAKITSNSVVAIKVAGNQSVLELNLQGSGSIAGICIFVTGNKGNVRVNLSTGLGNFIYRGRGNQSSGILNVQEGGSVVNILADLNGNGSKLEVSGSGSKDCRSARVVGKSSGFSCI